MNTLSCRINFFARLGAIVLISLGWMNVGSMPTSHAATSLEKLQVLQSMQGSGSAGSSGSRIRGLRQSNPPTADPNAVAAPVEKRPDQIPTPAPSAAATPPSRFQSFLAQGDSAPPSTTLEIFGRNFFRLAPTTFAPAHDVPVPADYIIGPGDEIVLRTWGQLDLEHIDWVDRQGNYSIPTVGTVTVAGLKYSQLNGYLRAAIKRLYKDFDMHVGLEQLRVIPIFVLGQTTQPGQYTVSALSTLVNAVLVAGGPTPQGSLRRIQLKRNGATIKEFDFYDLLLRGDKSQDSNLQAGDIIFIPPVGPLAAITGDVQNSAIYELKDTTTLDQLLEMSGGLATTAYGQKLSLERIVNREKRVVEELDLDAAARALPMQDGDLVRIRSIQPRFENAVTLKGNVAWPGRYPWREGMRIRDLLPTRAALMDREYWKRQNAMEGANKSLNATTHQLPEPNWEYAVIERLHPTALNTDIISFNLGKAIAQDQGADNIPLQAGDVITIFAKNDIHASQGTRTRFVKLQGEVAQPGIYQLQPGDTLRTLVERAGGLSPHAWLFAASLTRESVRQLQSERLKESLDRLESQMSFAAQNAVAQALSPESAIAAEALAKQQQELVARLRQVKPQGRIVLNLTPTSRDISQLPTLSLEDGDVFTVPTQPTLINVMGEVYNQNAFIFDTSKNTLADYLERAGGPSEHGDDDNIFIIRADGSVRSEQQTGWFGRGVLSQEALPGDTVVVPPKLQKVAWLRDFRDLTQIIMQIATTALIAVKL